MKTTKGGKVMNPTDAYRKEIRKRELKRNKKERKKVREVGILKKDPEQLKEQIEKLEVMKAEGALDKARKHKKRQLEDTLNLVLKKRKEYEEKTKEKGEEPVMFSHLGPPRRRTAAEEEERVKHPKPEDSVYYHPTLNPTGAPPPGKSPMFKSSIGPRIPLSSASSSGAASSSKSDVEDGTLSALPPPPPPPPLPPTGDADSLDGSAVPASLPLPPPPPMPPKPAMTDMGASLPLPPLPPPPPGPPPKAQIFGHPSLPPPPPRPPHQSAQPPRSGIGGNERDKNHSELDEISATEQNQAPSMLPPLPPPPGLQLKSDGMPADSDANVLEAKDHLKLPPPPPRQPPSGPGPAMVSTLQPDVLPPGISRFPPPPPPTDMRPPPGIAIQPGPPGMMVPLLPRPPFGPPGGPPLMMRLPLPPGPPPFQQDSARLLAPQKPSYVKSAASTVVKRPLAQHTPELTSMVPASVRVRRESALPKPKPKSSTAVTITQPAVTPPVVKHESTSASAPKPQSIDDSYTAFLEDMKALGALEG
ncbi:hypothetical protein CQW23_15358 [Capsicum baccatum]|uniref:Wbp11/ELF5/Saf1 N-terminal domain-containing protein n=1 Tax=Capsicum baccatum TaxID=33114 RepID=A0A2G2WM09_CAPBA|nr:hypothetical protein CQW23_15358 [Capsicum baccatum]